MIWPTKPLQIVRSWPGPGTLDTYHETEDGARWISGPGYGRPDYSSTAPPERGIIRDGTITPTRP